MPTTQFVEQQETEKAKIAREKATQFDLPVVFALVIIGAVVIFSLLRVSIGAIVIILGLILLTAVVLGFIEAAQKRRG